LKVQMLLFRRKLMLEIVEWVLHRECLMKVRHSFNWKIKLIGNKVLTSF
jgi:hypothetical protein